MRSGSTQARNTWSLGASMTRDRTISRSSSALAYAALATMILSLRALVNKVYALVSRMPLLRSIPIYNSGRIMRNDRARSGRWTSALPGSTMLVIRKLVPTGFHLRYGSQHRSDSLSRTRSQEFPDLSGWRGSVCVRLGTLLACYSQSQYRGGWMEDVATRS